MSATMSQEDATLLPERLRLPDLSQARVLARQDPARWHALAGDALAWGPDQRNGCTRTVDQQAAEFGGVREVDGVMSRIAPYRRVVWRNSDGELHSPDPWTPADWSALGTSWAVRGQSTRDEDQPAAIDLDTLTLIWRQGGVPHRAHAPATLHVHREPGWWWRGKIAPLPVERLLDQAWADPDLTGEQARSLLAGAEGTGVSGLPVTATAWLAHVIAAHPSTRLPEDLRTWCRLIAT